MALSEETIDKYRAEVNALLKEEGVSDEEFWIKFGDIHRRMKEEPGYEPPHFH